MALFEVEFELPAAQHRLMGYPGLRQGQVLSVILDAGVLLPDPGAESWYAVQKEPLVRQLKQTGRARYAFAGQIQEADLRKEQGEAFATLLVDCGPVALRVTCGPREDGALPYGTWETRYLAGYGLLQGVVEEDFRTPIGRVQDVTIWGFRRLVLHPGDPAFGEWHESTELPATPYEFDRVLVTARVHRTIIG